jgi:hypothetical protein
MVTGKQALEEVEGLCRKFGFAFSRSWIKEEKKEVVMMHAMLSTNAFYRDILKKEGSFDLKNSKKVNRLRRKAKTFIKRSSGGSGVLNWGELHEKEYEILKALTEEHARTLLWHPKYANEAELRKALPGAWLPYITPKYIPVFKFLAFIKFIYPEWVPLVEECRRACLEHEKLRKAHDFHILPWHWGFGEIDENQHASIIHEAIHTILENNKVPVFDHNAYTEGIDVFFHRISGLFLGHYEAKHWWSKGPRHYWRASEVFYGEFKDLVEQKRFKEIADALKDPKNARTRKVLEKIREGLTSEHFHD